jgi:hypothetical protein
MNSEPSGLSPLRRLQPRGEPFQNQRKSEAFHLLSLAVENLGYLHQGPMLVRVAALLERNSEALEPGPEDFPQGAIRENGPDFQKVKLVFNREEDGLFGATGPGDDMDGFGNQGHNGPPFREAA